MTRLTPEEVAQSTRKIYWQAMREACARIRGCRTTAPAARRTLAHFYSQWREAYDLLRPVEEQRKAA